MRPELADRAIDFMFRTPSPFIKVEFQGGEPLLNFGLIRHIVDRVEEQNATARARSGQFVIATNLASLSDAILDFCRDQNIFLSTSLDGPLIPTTAIVLAQVPMATKDSGGNSKGTCPSREWKGGGADDHNRSQSFLNHGRSSTSTSTRVLNQFSWPDKSLRICVEDR